MFHYVAQDWAHDTILLAPCSLLLALCSLLFALCSLLFALCSLLLAPCSLLLAPCSLLIAPYSKTFYSPQNPLSSSLTLEQLYLVVYLLCLLVLLHIGYKLYRTCNCCPKIYNVAPRTNSDGCY